MRDLTAAEDNLLNGSICPFCYEQQFLEGPHGLGSVNIMCAGCDAKFCYHQGLFVAQLIDEPDVHKAARVLCQKAARYEAGLE